MVQLIMGLKGSGKTKKLVDMVRDAAVSEGVFDSPEQYDQMMADTDLLPTPITPQPEEQRDQMAPGAVASQAQEDVEDEDMYVDPSEYD